MEIDQHHQLERGAAMDSKLQRLRLGPGCRRLPPRSGFRLVSPWCQERLQRVPHLVHTDSGAGYHRSNRRHVRSSGSGYTRQHRVRLVPRTASLHIKSIARRTSASPSVTRRSSAWMPTTSLTTRSWASATPRAILVSIVVAMPGGLPTSKITRRCGCSHLGCDSLSNKDEDTPPPRRGA